MLTPIFLILGFAVASIVVLRIFEKHLTGQIKVILNIFYSAVALGLAIWLFFIIREPIVEKRVFKMKRDAIIEKLENVRTAQIAFKDVTGEFADNWDTLIYTVKYGKFPIIKSIGDPNDTTVTHIIDTSYVPILDSIFSPNFAIDSIKYIPYTKGAIFEIQAGEIDQRGVPVKVFQVTDSKPYNKKYIDKGEQEPLTLGSMIENKYSGNWK